MRASLVALFAAAAVTSADILNCQQSAFKLDALIDTTSCGDKTTISRCLNAQTDLAQREEVARCFVASGCSEEQSAVEAERLERQCGGFAGNYGDLKRAVISETGKGQASDHNTAEGKKTEKQTAAPSTAAPSTAAAPTTQDPPPSTAAPSTLPSAAPSTTSQDSTSTPSTAAATTSTSTDSTSSALTTGSLICSVTSMVSTTLCSVSAGKTVSCFSTVTPVASCAPGNICFPAAPGAGAALCMKRDNHLTTSGLIIAITFGACITGFSGALIVMNARDRKQARRMQALALANTGKGRGDLETAGPYQRGNNRSASEANLPLIAPGGARSDQAYYPPQQQEYFDQQTQQRRGPSGSPGGRDGVPPVPTIQLHQGLGALDGGSYR